jgi:hypothetical protein
VSLARAVDLEVSDGSLRVNCCETIVCLIVSVNVDKAEVLVASGGVFAYGKLPIGAFMLVPLLKQPSLINTYQL